MNSKTGNIRAAVREALDAVPIDGGGGCSLEKATVMAWLIAEFDLKTSVDIGVYRGRSLVPQAVAHRDFSGGVAYGVDPYMSSAAEQFEVPAESRESVERWTQTTPFEVLYQEVVALLRRLDLDKNVEMIRQMSNDAARTFRDKKIFFDLVHIDGNHDSARVEDDVRNYLPLVRRGGFVVVDDISWESVHGALAMIGASCSLVYKLVDDDKVNDYAVFVNSNNPLEVATIAARIAAFDNFLGWKTNAKKLLDRTRSLWRTR